MNILNQIIEKKKEDISISKTKYSTNDFRNYFEFYHKTTNNFRENLKLENKIALIAEIKKASPSKGIIRENFHPLVIANDYINCSVNAISILTEEHFFKGSLEYLKTIAKISKTPLLRKDFIIDEYQIYESKAYGADAILLIAEILSKDEIKTFTQLAKELNLSVLLEIHSQQQIDKIDFSINDIVGINNRNLVDFKVDVNNSLEISKYIPDDIIIISESGITFDNVHLFKNSKINAFLIGEYFIKNDNIPATLNKFIEML